MRLFRDNVEGLVGLQLLDSPFLAPTPIRPDRQLRFPEAPCGSNPEQAECLRTPGLAKSLQKGSQSQTSSSPPAPAHTRATAWRERPEPPGFQTRRSLCCSGFRGGDKK